MPLPLSTPEALADDPELAALEILGSAAEISTRALFAAHPELTAGGDFFLEEPSVTPRQCLAVALLSALETLTTAVEHYRAHLDNLASSRNGRSDDQSF